MGPLVTHQWLPDSSGFFYTAGDMTSESFAFRAYFHSLGGEPAGAPEPVDVIHAPTVQVAADGKHAVVTAVWPLPQYVCDLPQRSWRPEAAYQRVLAFFREHPLRLFDPDRLAGPLAAGSQGISVQEGTAPAVRSTEGRVPPTGDRGVATPDPALAACRHTAGW